MTSSSHFYHTNSLIHCSQKHNGCAGAAMVTTRRRSQTIEPPALLPVAAPKRKRKNDAASASSAAQPPKQPPSKRRRNERGSANRDRPTAPTASTPTRPAPKKARLSRKERISNHNSQQQGEDEGVKNNRPKTGGTSFAGSRHHAHLDLTNDHESSEDETVRRPCPTASQDADDDADSRYALDSKRKGRTKKPVAATARRTAELKFEEDGLEEVDKAEAAVADARRQTFAQVSKRSPLTSTLVNNGVSGRSGEDHTPQVNKKRQDKAQRKTAPPTGVPSKIVMFTVVEAIEALSLYQEGTMSVPVKVDPHSRRPYEPLQTGEYFSYPVKGTYHLGSTGRYGVDTVPPLPFSLTVPLSEHSFIHRTQEASATSTTRRGLGFDSALTSQPKATPVRRPNNYCFTFGKYKGRRMDGVPVEYLRSIRDGDEYYNDRKLQQAFEDLYPKGLYESEAESYTFEKGGFKGKRLDEVPKTYLWGLLRKAKEDQLPKKGKGRLERALEVWEKGQLDLTKD
ncbi:uncharacterized protein EKO05_0005251 [Ascochyta rabiei]|uniref:uncharacterized protein n=1 Tax=Didymella rabiei TaxID=5454 RepID=UPI0018FF6191|nr:uncharacterized protein EKO05_0005251 [Ascochyta rabiei]UPX14779.1 hypothetical protein EKO05_0005251 [Ascochyta rabiei]